jgi:DNA-binding transcriptional ArsR family regulator
MMSSQPADPTLRPIAEIDAVVHSPARLMILALLSVVESADFTFVRQQTGLSGGNLSSHLSKLEEVGYVEIHKEFVGKVPRTLIRLSDDGRAAIEAYRKNMRHVLQGLGD